MATTGGGWEYPPMGTLQGATNDWQRVWLTSAVTRGQAAAVLNAESQTSVLDPRGQRVVRWKDIVFASLLGVVVVTGVLAALELYRSGELPAWVMLLAPLVILLNLGGTYLTPAATRVVPAAVPPGPGGRRRRRALYLSSTVATPAATWPAGSEAYAVLAGAASVTSVAPSWLAQQVGLEPEVGAQWVAALRRPAWLTGGGHILGVTRLPELHVELTDAGRQRLDAERARLLELAGR